MNEVMDIPLYLDVLQILLEMKEVQSIATLFNGEPTKVKQWKYSGSK